VTRARRGRRRGRGSGRTYRRVDLPSRVAASARGSFTFPREPPRRRPKSPASAARSRARQKRTLAAFLQGQAAASYLTPGSRARSRAKAANTGACSPRAQGRPGPPSQTHPICRNGGSPSRCQQTRAPCIRCKAIQ